MDDETLAFGVPLAGLTVGMVVLLLGVPQGGVNPTLVAGGVIMLVAIGWMSLNLAAMEPQ